MASPVQVGATSQVETEKPEGTQPAKVGFSLQKVSFDSVLLSVLVSVPPSEPSEFVVVFVVVVVVVHLSPSHVVVDLDSVVTLEPSVFSVVEPESFPVNEEIEVKGTQKI